MVSGSWKDLPVLPRIDRKFILTGLQVQVMQEKGGRGTTEEVGSGEHLRWGRPE